MRALVLLLLVPPVFAEDVSFRTEDGVDLAASFQPAGKDAPTVICLPMYRSTKESYKTLVGPLVRKGTNVLCLDLRGHGKSAPELAERVAKRDPALFAAMYRDVEAAVAYLESKKGCDRTRIGLVGASVGCSVAIDFTRRHPGDVRAVVLLTPGSDYLGLDSLEQLKEWPGTTTFVFTSSEEQKVSQGVMDALARFHGSNHMVIPGEKLHGTRMFGKVNQLEELIANYFESFLAKSADLRPGEKMLLRRGDASVLATPKSVTVTGGSATLSIAGKKAKIKAGEPFAWTWKTGDSAWIEVRPPKGPKIRFPSKGHYALMPLLDDG